MPMSFPVSFLLGRELSRSVGVENAADQTASGIALAITGGTPVGIVLARQLALNRVPSPTVPSTSTSAPGTASTVGASGSLLAARFGYAINGQHVQFADQSSGPVQRWRWTFKDGDTVWSSNDQHPVCDYVNTGPSRVTLTVFDAQGASNTSEATIVIAAPTAQPSPAAPSAGRVVADFEPFVDGAQVTFVDRSTGTIRKYEWKFDDKADAKAEASPKRSFGAGIHTATLTVTGPGDLVSSTTRRFQVAAAPAQPESG